MSAIPTGSLAPDSPSRSTPVRPVISRRPSTEKTTAGSVGASAVPSSSAVRQSNLNRWAATASRAAVAKVLATPIHATAPALGRKRLHPMFMPPLNSSTTSATVTAFCTAMMGGRPSHGHRSDATAATSRRNARAGMRVRSLSRLDNTATSVATATASNTRLNDSTPCTAAPSLGTTTCPGLAYLDAPACRRAPERPKALPGEPVRRHDCVRLGAHQTSASSDTGGGQLHTGQRRRTVVQPASRLSTALIKGPARPGTSH